jgi:outer membrane receptor protein involved in Fe transport
MRRQSSLTYITAGQLNLPGVYNVTNIKPGVDPINYSKSFEQRINSVLGFGQFSYDNMLFIDFSMRNDWASILPTDNNSFLYPAASASVVLSDALNINKDIVSFLKVRGGWSKVGSTGVLGAYQLENTYSFTSPWAGTNLVASPSLLNNPDIGPESTTSTEFGIDGRFLKNRIRLDASYYNQKSEDLIVNVQLSSTSGNGSALQNVGEMTNKGFEIALGATLFKNDDWKVDLDLNFAKNDNTVESLGGDLETLVLGGQWGVNIEARVGEAYGTIYGPGYARNEDGNIIYENGLPTVDTERKVLGNVTPDWTGGANLTVAYKNFSFGALVDAKIGGDIFSMTNTWGRYAGVLEETAEGRETGVVGAGVMNVGTEENPVWAENNVVVTAKAYNRAAYVNSVAEGSVFDASYVKLRQLSLGYKLPSKMLKNTGLDEINLSVVGRNLAILHRNAPHIDPESAFSSSNGNQGLEFGQLPSARSVGLNVGIKF